MRLLKYIPGLLAAAMLFLQGCDFGSAPGGGTGGEGLTGRLVDGAGAPVAGVTVRVHPTTVSLGKSSDVSAARAMLRAMEAGPESTVTNAEGRYRFKKLPTGMYNLEASVRSQDTTYALFLPGIAFKRSLDLGVDTLQASGELRLMVRDEGGSPLPDARCFIAGSSWSTLSDAGGICVLEGVAPGTYVVRVSAPGLDGETPPVTVSAGQVAIAGTVILEGWMERPWITASIKGYAYDIPEGLELTAGGDDSGGFQFAWYFGPPVTLLVGLEMVSIEHVDTMPGYSETLLFEDASVRAIVGSYLDIRAEFADTSRGVVLKLIDRATQQRFLNFEIGFREESSRPLVMRIVNSVRKWEGPGKAPGSPPQVPTLHSVPEGAVDVPLNPDFLWVPSGTVDYYQLQISRDSSFATFVFNDSLVDGRADSLRVSGLQANTRYYWRIGSRKAGFATRFSVFQTFMTGTINSGFTLRRPAGAEVLNDVVWNGALWVAVGNGGTLLTSPDGETWTSRSSGTAFPLRGVTWTGTKFIAVGWSVILTSTDGLTWNAQNIENKRFNDVVWTGTQAWAVGDSGLIRVSEDGLSWTDRSQPFKDLVAIGWDVGVFIALGDGDSSYRSTDGLNWTRHAVYTSSEGSVVRFEGRWYAGIWNPSVSTDGREWSSLPMGGPLYFAAKVAGGLFAGGVFGDLLRSADGNTWETLYTGHLEHLRAAATDGARQVVVGGTSGGIIMTSR